MPQTTSHLPEIGYLFHYPSLDHPSEKFRLDIYLSTHPTEKHFDVLKASFSALTSHGPESSLEIYHPWKLTQQIQVCAGQVTMEDRKGKKELGFTFGGQLSIDTGEMQTACSLISPAPILHLTEVSRNRNAFVEEVELLLAEIRAEYHDQDGYLKRLCGINADDLYQAFLLKVRHKLENMPNRDKNHEELLVYIHAQEHRLHAAGLLKQPRPTVRELFGIP